LQAKRSFDSKISKINAIRILQSQTEISTYLGHGSRRKPVLPFEHDIARTPKVGHLVLKDPSLKRENPFQEDQERLRKWSQERRESQ
jgi:hypothetical protein